LPEPTDIPDAQQERASFWNVIGHLQAQQTQTAQALTDLLAAVQLTIASAAAPPPAPAPPVAPAAAPIPVQTLNKPLKFREPRIFDGKVAQVEPFLDEIEQGIRGQRMTDPIDMTGYMSTYLKDGDPKTWYYAIKKSQPTLLADFTGFVAAFRSHFADSNAARTALRKITDLKQSGSCAAYTARYWELLPLVDFSETTKLEQYKAGLKKEVRERVSLVRPKPANFEAYVALAIDFDNEMHEEVLEEKARAKRNGKTPATPRPSTTSQASTALSPGEPMEIDSVKVKRGPLTAEEKERRRREGLCSYCGVKGHFADSCPNKSEAAKKRDAERKAKSTSGNAQ
jgi:hypothetical protein